MRTRRSNRSKRYTYDEDEFEKNGLGDERNGDRDDSEAALRLTKRQQRAEEVDENFEDTAAVRDSSDNGQSEAEEEDQDDNGEGVSDMEASANGDNDIAPATADAAKSPSKTRRSRPRRKSQLAAYNHTTTYLSTEPFILDPHLPRGYTGGFDRHIRGVQLAQVWYGPRDRDIDIALRLLEQWMDWPLLPPREDATEQLKGIWVPDVFEKEAQYALEWHERLDGDTSQGRTLSTTLKGKAAATYQLRPGSLPVLMGPHDCQKEVKFGAGDSSILSQYGIPLDKDEAEDKTPSSWILDAGGIVLSLDWARNPDPDSSQHLALAVIPHADQENHNYEEEVAKPDYQQQGTIQIWEFHGEKNDTEGSIRPAARKPKLLRTLCLDYGRARCVKWSPVGSYLAILCGNGDVCVVEPLKLKGAGYQKITQPLATLHINKDIKATAITWVTLNRLAVGYGDGSIALWSIYPTCLLSRHLTHHSSIVDIASGHPTFPYLVASVPIGGRVKLTDLRNPSRETTEVATLAVCTSSNLLSWSDHLGGFFAMVPSSNVLNTLVGFMHHAHFPIVRRTFTGDSFVTCLSVGKTHPFLLVGQSDGSLYALNPQFELFQLKHGRRGVTDRIRIFQHEHRSKTHFPAGSPAAQRGVSRILHGFNPEKNYLGKSDAKASAAKKSKKKKAAAAAAAAAANADDEDGEQEQDDAAGPQDPTRGILYEPLSRITAVEWNPNVGYGCWAAVSMASGLVKVMDLGLDKSEAD